MLLKKEQCCGCSACEQVCPSKCISMKPDKEGFLVPEINRSKCTSCGMCEHVCPIYNKKVGCYEIKAYAAKCKEQQGGVRGKSSSGGMFWCFARYILKQGGLVVGVAMGNNCFFSHHIAITNESELYKLLGSKYVQSYKGNIFSSVRDYLKQGKYVLFSGLPCEISGLINFIPIDLQDKLYTIDLICHGVPSPLVWQKYLSEKVSNAKSVEFRNKSSGWKNFSIKIYSDENCITEEVGQNIYMKGFLEHLYLRNSCHNCKFKGIQRSSDITLGDFWNVNDFVPEFDDDKGVSLVFIQSQKGSCLFSSILDCYELDYKEVDVAKAGLSNPMMLYSSKPHKKRDKFFKLLNKNKPVIKSIKKLTRRTFLIRALSKVKSIIKNVNRGV